MCPAESAEAAGAADQQSDHQFRAGDADSLRLRHHARSGREHLDDGHHLHHLKQSKKGGGAIVGYLYHASLAMAFCEGPASILQIYGDSKLIYDVNPDPAQDLAAQFYPPWDSDTQPGRLWRSGLHLPAHQQQHHSGNQSDLLEYRQRLRSLQQPDRLQSRRHRHR